MSIFEKSEKEVMGLVTPITQSMQAGWDENDYDKFSEHFSTEMKSDVNIESFSQQRKELIPELGKHQEMSFVATHKNPDNFIVIWRLSFSKRELPTLVTYVFKEIENKLKIAGVMLQS